jgi:uncharacterized protein YndB with AHSA1/START domain
MSRLSTPDATSGRRRHLPHGDALAGGEGIPNTGCYLEVIENEKRVRTAALKPGHRPQSAGGAMLFTAAILLEPRGAGTKYTAIAIHGGEEGAKKHADMGFHEGWDKTLDQLVALAKKM